MDSYPKFDCYDFSFPLDWTDFGRIVSEEQAMKSNFIIIYLACDVDNVSAQYIYYSMFKYKYFRSASHAIFVGEKMYIINDIEQFNQLTFHQKFKCILQCMSMSMTRELKISRPLQCE